MAGKSKTIPVAYEIERGLGGNGDYCGSGGSMLCGTSEKGVFLYKDCTLLT